jgi:hypothetical protein
MELRSLALMALEGGCRADFLSESGGHLAIGVENGDDCCLSVLSKSSETVPYHQQSTILTDGRLAPAFGMASC